MDFDYVPLNVMDLVSPNRFGPVFVEASVQAGFPATRDFNGPEQEGVGMYQVTHKRGERFSAAKAYPTPNLSRPNLKVITNAHTMRVLMEGKRAVGVEFVQDGAKHQLRATREVIVSAGALLSPQILMLSGIGPAAHLREHGIALVHDSPGVGANLHDHVNVVQVVDAPHLRDLFASRSRASCAPSRASTNGATCAPACSPPTTRKPAASSRALVADALPAVGRWCRSAGPGYAASACLARPFHLRVPVSRRSSSQKIRPCMTRSAGTTTVGM